MKELLREFKKFAIKGNVIDMAVGVIIGGAFSSIVSSFVNDLVMPLIGVLIGKINIADMAITLAPAVGGSPAVLLKYGAFLQTVIDFFILSVCIFAAVKIINRLKDAVAKDDEAVEAAAPPKLIETDRILTEIRDILKDSKGSD